MDKKLTNERIRQVEQTQDVLRQNIQESVRLIESSEELLARIRAAPEGKPPTD